MPRKTADIELRVFVASPGDVADERDCLPRVIDELNAKGGAARQNGVRLVLQRWEDGVTPDVGRPQRLVFEQLPADEWDIFIGILWLRFGKATGASDPATGQPFLSGTDEEFQAAYRLRQARGDGFPRVMFYRCARPPADITRLDLKQYARVQAFFDDFLPGGSHPGLVSEFKDTAEFERSVRRHLSQFIADFASAAPAPAAALPSSRPVPGSVPAEPDRQAAMTVYLKKLRQACDALPLAALDDDARQNAQMTLNHVYIALDTTTRVPLTDEEKKSRKEKVLFGRDEDRALAVLEAAEQHPHLVITGEPGGGKSSFVNRLAFLLAGARLTRAPLPAQWTHGALLPVRFFLRELAPMLPAEKDLARLSTDQRARVLSDAVREFAGKLPATFDAADAAPLLLTALDAGECLVVFDGLDEVAPDRRKIAREAVEVFAQRCADNRFLVTCRIRSYQHDARLTAFDEVTLARFDDRKIAEFVAAWYTARVDLGQMPWDQANDRAKDLHEAVRDQKLRELAETPLLLTTMAVVHTAQVTLPRERAVLYLRCVEILLRRWHKHKAGELPLLDELGVSEQELLKALAAVAFEAHRHGKKDEAADLPKKDVLATLSRRLGNYAKADHFLEHVEDRAGLLLGHGGVDEDEPVYSFPHRTFQEFLAGYHLALSGLDFGRELRARLGEGDKWTLAAQLGAEHLLYNTGDSAKVLDALGKLCPVSPPRDDVDWRALAWAGNIAAEMGAERIKREDTDNPDGGANLLERLMRRLVELIEQSKLSSRERVDAGAALGQIGDPRPDVSCPIPVLVPIPAGGFLMGSKESANDDEKPHHRVTLKAYRIGKYPVTNAQFRRFVDDGGYSEKHHDCWTDAGWKWREENQFEKPEYWESAKWNLDNHPVVGVSWYEAVAYCNWLTKTDLQKRKFRLPTEAEWEKAARSDDTREYPWTGEFNAEKANTSETRIGRTTAVGLFPLGESPYHALDMAGNVLDWCSDWYDENYYKNSPAQNPLGPTSGQSRVLRGGSWSNDRGYARCAYRLWYAPSTSVTITLVFGLPSPLLPELGSDF